MNNEELLSVLELLSSVEPSLHISPKVRDISSKHIYNLILVFVQGSTERIRLYTKHSNLGAWSELCQCLLDIPNVVNKDLGVLTLLKERVVDIISVVVTNTFDGDHEDFNTIKELPFKDYMPELIDLYESLLTSCDERSNIVRLLRSNNPSGTFIELCTDSVMFSFYCNGVHNKYFPPVTWELIEQVVEKYYSSNVLDLLNNDYLLTLLIRPKDLEPYQLEYLISKGLTYFIYEGIKQQGISIPDGNKERVKQAEEWLRLERLEEQYPTIESIASNWYSISRRDRKYLYGRNSRRYTQVGESPLRIRTMNLALVMAGVHEVTLTSRLPDYYNEEELNEV